MTTPEEYAAQHREKRFREAMADAGIPRHLWEVGPGNPAPGTKWPTGSTLDTMEKLARNAAAVYEKGGNTGITGGTYMAREQVAAWIAHRILEQDNDYYRYYGEHKHLDKGEPAKFSVKMADVDDLERMYKDASKRDDQDPFDIQVCAYDFFFIKEIGRERANAFTSRILMDTLTARVAEELPTFVTLAKDLGNVMAGTEGENPYWEIDAFIKANYRGWLPL